MKLSPLIGKGSSVSNITLYDGANDFRITIKGKLSGSCVDDLAQSWQSALKQQLSRRYTVDISGLTGYDTEGRKLLRRMYRHGISFAAATPMSLVFLNEISAPPRRAVPMISSVLPEEASVDTPSPKSARSATITPPSSRAASGK